MRENPAVARRVVLKTDVLRILAPSTATLATVATELGADEAAGEARVAELVTDGLVARPVGSSGATPVAYLTIRPAGRAALERLLEGTAPTWPAEDDVARRFMLVLRELLPEALTAGWLAQLALPAPTEHSERRKAIALADHAVHEWAEAALRAAGRRGRRVGWSLCPLRSGERVLRGTNLGR
jgi:hypothetical protein